MTMRPIRETIPLEQALDLLLAASRPSPAPSGSRSTARTDGCWPQAVTPTVDVPPFDRAAMDGYAVIAPRTRSARRHDPRTLRSVDTIFTGDTPTRPSSAGECVEIATGAPMPDGADAVVMVEETERADGRRRARDPTPVYPRPERRPPRRRHRRPARRSCSRRRPADPEPARRDRGDRRG